MSVDPKSVVSAIGSCDRPVRLSELDDLYVRVTGRDVAAAPNASEITSGLATAIRNGWIHTDGLRVFVSGSGRQVLGY